jgi:nucleotide-binding universal stress UspA family protein
MPDQENAILVAVDFSPSSEQALIWAARAARRFGAPLVVLHVVHDPSSAPGYDQHERKREKHLIRLEEAAAEMMEQFLERMTQKHPKLLAKFSHRLVVGLPITRILEVAEDVDAQMIVMGSRGRTGLPHLLLGSKAERVVQLSPIPVTIVKASTKAD